jgi:hypothetical protein
MRPAKKEMEALLFEKRSKNFYSLALPTIGGAALGG